MCRYIAPLMVGMDHHVKAQQALHFQTVKSHHVSQVPRPVEARVGIDVMTVVVKATVYVSGNSRQPGNQVHHIFVHEIPVELFVNASPVCLLEYRLRRHGQNGRTENGHRPGNFGHDINDVKNMLRNMAPGGPVPRNVHYIIPFRDLSNQHQVKQSLGKRFSFRGQFGQFLPQFRKRISPETDSFICI